MAFGLAFGYLTIVTRSVAVWAKGIVVSENGLQMNRINDCCRSVADASINHGAAVISNFNR